LIVVDVVDLQSAGRGIAHDHVARAAARKIAEAADLPIQADRAQRRSIGDLAVGDVVDLQCAVAVAQDHVGLTEAAEIAEA
jgi:hypothetical protein